MLPVQEFAAIKMGLETVHQQLEALQRRAQKLQEPVMSKLLAGASTSGSGKTGTQQLSQLVGFLTVAASAVSEAKRASLASTRNLQDAELVARVEEKKDAQ